MLYTIWHHMYNFKNVKNITFFTFFRFHKWYQIVQSVSYCPDEAPWLIVKLRTHSSLFSSFEIVC